MIYLYVKTHNKTGLKYLGKTEQDPFKYKGSGKYWKNHIRKHGYDITTEILLETEDTQKIKEIGTYYSELWNIVESVEWANFRPEDGNGGATYGMSGKKHTEKFKDLRSKSMKDIWKNRNKNIHGQKISNSWSSDRKNKHSNLLKENNPNKKGNSHVSGRVWVNNKVSETLIKKEELELYKENGFIKGRK